MEKRHQDLLTTRLEESYLNGCSHITWTELYCWYGVQKIAARTYRDLETRWQDLTGGRVGRLMKIEGKGGVHVFGESMAQPVDQNSLLEKL
jgi:hypothetical protein